MSQSLKLIFYSSVNKTSDSLLKKAKWARVQHKKLSFRMPELRSQGHCILLCLGICTSNATGIMTISLFSHAFVLMLSLIHI